MVTYEYFYIKYFVILKNMLNISNFHGKALRKKKIPPPPFCYISSEV